MSIKAPQEIFIAGNDIAILLLHAYTGSSNDLRLLAQDLSRQGYTVYLPIYRGHGTVNVEDILAYSAEDWWLDTQEAIQYLQDKGYKKIIVMGLSMGGMMAARAAEEYDVLAAGSFCSPVTLETTLSQTLYKNFLAYAEKSYQLQGFSQEEIADKLVKIKKSAKSNLKALEDLTKDTAQKVEKIDVPYYIAQGGKDTFVDPMASVTFRDSLTQSQVDFHWFEDSPHVISVGKDRLAFQESVKKFIEKVTQQYKLRK